MITINNLSRTFDDGRVRAVDAVTLDVSAGELFGVIGPDGAGKTTLFRMLTTLLLPDGGTASVDGFDIVRDYKSMDLGILIQHRPVYGAYYSCML